VSDLVAVASRPNWDYLGERLRRIDALVADAAVEALAPSDASRCGTRRRAQPRVTGARWTRRPRRGALRLLRQRARETLRCPRVDRLGRRGARTP